MITGQISHWWRDIGYPSIRPALDGDTSADICIIGGGYTGLWTAWYLKQIDPGCNVLLIEKTHVGFGASGRNGGWLTGGFAWNHSRYAARTGEASVRAMVEAMNGTVDEVIRVAEAEGIDADVRRTDELVVATNQAQLARMQSEVAHRRAWGEEERVQAIGPDVRDRIAIPGVLGAMVVKNVARFHPAKLVSGLAAACERAGVRIVEGTAATHIRSGRVTTDCGEVRARVILRATEGFTADLAGHRRDWLPMNSAQVATEPLPASVWKEIGWNGRELLSNFAHSYCYCQRSEDDRILVGARGVPYRWGSAIDADGAPDAGTVSFLTEFLGVTFPAARAARIDHAWCGVLAVPRDWCATVVFDAASGIGYAGGYVGVGVSTSNLAGRTLADLALGRTSPLTRLAWVNHRVRKWEPEPFRWLGVHTMYALLSAADRAEARGVVAGNWAAKVASKLMGQG